MGDEVSEMDTRNCFVKHSANDSFCSVRQNKLVVTCDASLGSANNLGSVCFACLLFPCDSSPLCLPVVSRIEDVAMLPAQDHVCWTNQLYLESFALSLWLCPLASDHYGQGGRSPVSEDPRSACRPYLCPWPTDQQQPTNLTVLFQISNLQNNFQILVFFFCSPTSDWVLYPDCGMLCSLVNHLRFLC